MSANRTFSYNLVILKQLTPVFLAFALLIAPQIPIALAQSDFSLKTSQEVYVPGETLEIRGTGQPNELLAVRIYDPDGQAIRIDSVQVESDGTFRKVIMVWPEPTRN